MHEYEERRPAFFYGFFQYKKQTPPSGDGGVLGPKANFQSIPQAVVPLPARGYNGMR
jgi:hypothetical protein